MANRKIRTPEEQKARNKAAWTRQYEKMKLDRETMDRRNQKAKEWYYANKERAIKRMMEYNKDHPVSREYSPDYYAAHREKMQEYQRQYRARKKLQAQKGKDNDQ